MGWERADGELDRTGELRACLFTLLGVGGEDPAVLDWARKLVDAVLDGSGPEADPSLVAAAVGVVATFGDEADYERFSARAAAAANPQEERRFLYSLADFRTMPSSTARWSAVATATSAPRTPPSSSGGPSPTGARASGSGGSSPSGGTS